MSKRARTVPRPTLRDVDLNLLVLFDAMMRTGKLTAAAERLGMTQSAASQALGRLRRTFDDELFLRTGSGMTPTQRARELAPFVADGLRSIDRALGASVEFQPTESQRSFRLAFGDTDELALLPRIVAAVGAAGPSLGVISVPGAAGLALSLAKNGEVDFAFDYAPPEVGYVHHRKLAETDMVVIARVGHPTIRGRVSRSQFFGARHVVLALAGDRRAAVERFIQNHGERRAVLTEAAHYASVPALVQETDAIAIIPRSMIEVRLHEGRFQVLRPPFQIPPLRLFAIWHNASNADPGHVWLRRTVEAALGSTRP